MPKLFRNNSPGTLTRKQATALMKERIGAQSGGGAGHDVSNEPRVPKGSGDESGQWTRVGSAADLGPQATLHPKTVVTCRVWCSPCLRSGRGIALSLTTTAMET